MSKYTVNSTESVTTVGHIYYFNRNMCVRTLMPTSVGRAARAKFFEGVFRARDITLLVW